MDAQWNIDSNDILKFNLSAFDVANITSASSQPPNSIIKITSNTITEKSETYPAVQTLFNNFVMSGTIKDSDCRISLATDLGNELYQLTFVCRYFHMKVFHVNRKEKNQTKMVQLVRQFNLAVPMDESLASTYSRAGFYCYSLYFSKPLNSTIISCFDYIRPKSAAGSDRYVGTVLILKWNLAANAYELKGIYMHHKLVTSDQLTESTNGALRWDLGLVNNKEGAKSGKFPSLLIYMSLKYKASGDYLYEICSAEVPIDKDYRITLTANYIAMDCNKVKSDFYKKGLSSRKNHKEELLQDKNQTSYHEQSFQRFPKKIRI